MRVQGRAASESQRSLTLLVGIAVTALLCGCARMKTAWRSQEPVASSSATSIEPPSVEGSFIRSQDGTKLARRGGPRRSNAPEVRRAETPQTAPAVAWTTPGSAPSPQPLRVDPVPAPPRLPDDRADYAAAGAEAPAPPTAVLQEPTFPTNDPDTAAAPASIAYESTATDPRRGERGGAVGAADSDAMVTMRKLVNESKNRLGALTSYRTRMTRQERVGETLLPREEVVLSIRREPLAVRLEWPTGPSQGREVLFATVETGGKMEIFAPKSLVPRLALAPDSPLVQKNSRHPITEAGFDSVIRNMDAALHAAEQGRADAGRFVYEGAHSLPELGRECHRILEARPNGETWIVCLDAETLLPALVHAVDSDGQLLEYYLFRDLTTNLPELAQSEAFSPDKRWGESRGGVLGRIARGIGESGQTRQ